MHAPPALVSVRRDGVDGSNHRGSPSAPRNPTTSTMLCTAVDRYRQNRPSPSSGVTAIVATVSSGAKVSADVERSDWTGPHVSSVRNPFASGSAAVRLNMTAVAPSGGSTSTGSRQPASGRPVRLHRSTSLPASSTTPKQIESGSS